MAPQPKFSFRRYFKEHIEIVAILILIALGIRLFVMSAYRVTTVAMAPTLDSGDFIFGFRLPYGVRLPILGSKLSTHHMPSRGDVVAFQMRDEALETSMYVKRVIGLPGDRIEVKQGRINLNGTWLSYQQVGRSPASDEAQLKPRLATSTPQTHSEWSEGLDGGPHDILVSDSGAMVDQAPIVVPPESVYVLTDNRSQSDDSRQFGPIRADQIEAHTFLVWLSLSWESANLPSIRWDRVLTRIN